MTVREATRAIATRITGSHVSRHQCCGTCGCDWTADEHDEHCDECGGGALTRPCPICGGRCGHDWKRDVRDSQVAGQAYWHGCCSYAVRLFKAQAPADQQAFFQ